MFKKNIKTNKSIQKNTTNALIFENRIEIQKKCKMYFYIYTLYEWNFVFNKLCAMKKDVIDTNSFGVSYRYTFYGITICFG